MVDRSMNMFTNLKLDSYNISLSFNINKDVQASFVNALRRVVLSNIPNLGFCYEPEKYRSITIKENTTGLHDEFLAHRISLIPVINKFPSP